MPSSQGKLWIVGGPNGAGKSTFIKRVTAPGGALAGVPAPNLDRHTDDLLRQAGFADPPAVPAEVYWHYFKQADAALQSEIEAHIRAGRVVCVETVLSTPKYQAVVDLARSCGVPFYFVYVTLTSPELAQERVAHRVSHGGHPVPPDKVVERFRRSLDNLPRFAAQAQEFFVFDNSSSSATAGPLLAVQGANGKVTAMDPACSVELARRFEPLLPRPGAE